MPPARCLMMVWVVTRMFIVPPASSCMPVRPCGPKDAPSCVQHIAFACHNTVPQVAFHCYKVVGDHGKAYGICQLKAHVWKRRDVMLRVYPGWIMPFTTIDCAPVFHPMHCTAGCNNRQALQGVQLSLALAHVYVKRISLSYDTVCCSLQWHQLVVCSSWQQGR
jgi:hypothetical protein